MHGERKEKNTVEIQILERTQVTTSYCLLQLITLDEKVFQASTVVGRALFNPAVVSSRLTIQRKHPIKNDFKCQD